MFESAIFGDEAEDTTPLLIKNRMPYFNYSIKIKHGLLIMILMVYISLMVMKAYYLRRQRIEELKEMIRETQRHIMRLYTLDQQLAVQIQQAKDLLSYSS